MAGSQMTILLAEDAVNYGVRGQHGTGIKIAGAPVQPGFLIETDVQSVQEARIPVYAFREDLEERGIGEEELVPGIRLLSRWKYGRFVQQFDSIWNW